MTAQRHDVRALTGVRGLAAWLVVLYHVRRSIAGLPPSVETWLGKGYLAVDFFFLLSGFVIWMSYAERLRSGGGAALRDFLKRRVARVWPLHLVMLGYAVALALALAATGRHDPAAFPFAQLPLHVALLQNWGFTGDLTWNDPAWSISCEAAAYLLFPVLAVLADWRRMPTPLLLLALAGLFALLHGAMAAGGAPTLGTDIPRFGLLRCLVEFTAGTALCALWQRWKPVARQIVVRCAMVAGVASTALLSGVAAETLAVPALLATLLLAIALTADWRGNPLATAPIHYLGEISYATYLSHFMLFYTFKLAFVVDAGAVPPWQIAAYLALVLIVSVALYHLVERPAQRVVNRFGGSRALRVAAG